MSISVSIMQGGVNNHPTTSEEANGIATDFVSEGIVGAYTNTSGVAPATGAFAVNAQGTPDMTVAVSAGVAYVTGTPSSQNSQTFRVKSGASENVTIAANSSGSTKYDWVYIKLDATLLNAPTLAGTTTATLVTSRSTSSSSDDGTPPTYGYPIAVVTVANGASSIANSVIRDIRTNAGVDTAAGANTGWISGALPQVSSVTENGNRSASITFASTVASILTPGMRIRTSRTVAAPTQCTSLNGTTQYYSKTTPNKLTFTDDFTVSAWVKLTSYAAGYVVSRYNGTSGWGLNIQSTGQVQMIGFNAGAANYRYVQSYQSVPLNKWVHITAFLDMSGNTYTSDSGATNNYIMIDGVVVPGFMTAGGTSPMALIQAGDLNIGAANGGTFFPGKIAQVAIYNARVTPTTIRTTKNQTLSGSETSIASAYSFNNVITDLNTTTPNDLTANGSAIATNADSPFCTDANGTPAGTYDWAIVTKAPTTVVTVQYPEGCAIPTSGGISTVDYSGVKAPFGMPTDFTKWSVVNYYKADFTQSSPVSGTWYNLTTTSGTTGGMKINLPVGRWKRGYSVPGITTNSTNQPSIFTTLSTANNTESDSLLTATSQVGIQLASGYTVGHLQREDRAAIDVTTATDYYLNAKTGAASAGTTALRCATEHAGTVYADLAYL